MASPTPTLAELEARMRPRALSIVGFLGPAESLTSVLSTDEAALKKIGLTFEILAAKLETQLAAAKASPTHEAVVDAIYQIRIEQTLGFQICPWSPDPRRAQCIGCGLQYSSLDWRLENLRTGKVLTGPGLIVHLMHDHHFCEGQESPYRVDPTRLAQLLELV